MQASDRCALITGAAGFLGSHLVKKLLASDWQVIALDNLCAGTLDNLRDVANHPRLHTVLADICQRDYICGILAQFSPQIVFHLAAHHFIPYCETESAEAVRVNVLGTQTLVEAVQRVATTQRFMFVSTGDVYTPMEQPHQETSPVAPSSLYGTTKLACEQLLQVAAKKSDIDFTIARLFNIYGPQETNPHIIPEIISQLKSHDRQPLHLGSIWPKRDFIFVEDVADALISLVAIDAHFDVVNVGGGQAYAIEDLVQIIGTLLKRNIQVVTDPQRVRPVERPHLEADISKINRLTGWAPAWTIETGLAHLLAAEDLMASKAA